MPVSDSANYQKPEKDPELKKLRDILIATIDYWIDCHNKSVQRSTGFDPVENLKDLKRQAEELYLKRKVTKLKHWLRDMCEMPRETKDLNYVTYIKKATGHDYNIFTAFNKRIDNIVAKGKISTDNQCREVESMVDYMSQSESVDDKKIEVLNNLLLDYHHRLTGGKGKPKRFKKSNDKFDSKLLVRITSPDNKKTFEINEHFTNGVYENTSSLLMWADGGGAVFYFNGKGLEISARWIDSQTLEVTHDKRIVFSTQDKEFYYRGDKGSILYQAI
jgi:hypothetical protein